MATLVQERPRVYTRLADLEGRRNLAGQFQDLRGWDVISPAGRKVGEVVDEYIDTKSGQIGLLALRLHGGGGRPWPASSRTVLIPFSDVEAFGDRHIRVRSVQEYEHLDDFSQEQRAFERLPRE